MIVPPIPKYKLVTIASEFLTRDHLSKRGIRNLPPTRSHWMLSVRKLILSQTRARLYTPSMSSLKIGTHNGTFHCDEALAVFLLRQTPKYKNAGKSLQSESRLVLYRMKQSDLIRTRDPALLDKCDIVVDVGAEYDATRFRFDHHQRGFTDVFGHGFQTKLSSAGLIYK
jgi:hypothetical protein